MGQYLNPSNYTFEKAINSEIFVDKTGLISFLNERIQTTQNCICSTRPRRFGKSMAVAMISAYYELENDSRKLFKGCIAENDENFEEHLNKYDVISIDLMDICIGEVENEKLIDYMNEEIKNELKEKYGDYIKAETKTLGKVLSDINVATKKQFVVLIDEWDALFRLYKEDKKLQRDYMDFLRSLFKGQAADRFIALAYMTGILPIKKYGTESGLNNFREHTMVEPFLMKEFIGFTEEEVEKLCDEYDMDLDDAKKWYSGYEFRWEEDEEIAEEEYETVKKNIHIYSPNSIVEAMLNRRYSSYWSETETFESLQGYIEMDFVGLKEDVIKLIAGERCEVDVMTYDNDLTSFGSKDDVLTALIHLGYLAYDGVEKNVYIPNEDVMLAFNTAVEMSNWQK